MRKAVEGIDKMQCYVVKTPVETEIRYRRVDAAKSARLVDMNGEYFDYVDAYTRKGILKNIEDVVFRL